MEAWEGNKTKKFVLRFVLRKPLRVSRALAATGFVLHSDHSI